ncbi:KAP family P-loop NTPase fold protein [Vibrio brasiliensis]|uniref:KAP family P-loop NTPase fold protein n=1 Tax=Vibrio brasiliensis TaxID=170652 RepID=UPI001EFD94DA|nr:KAP family NTPase [Vibrio brasiliensis]
MANINQVPTTETFDKYTIIDRKPYAKHLTDFLNSKAEQGYVINLNAEWGAGKTTFLQCWYNELKAKHPVVYFDAWKSDFSHDAMMALMECFNTQLISPLKENKELYNQIKDRVGNLLKVALPSLVVGYLKHKTGTDSDESLLGDISTELGLEINDSELAGALKETMKAMLQQKKQVDGLHAFKGALEELGECYLDVHKNKSTPIYILIDELDRCRPSYAIEVIECVKHFFNTKNFVFVLATDTDQLQHSIKAIYGSGFNSSAYLSRFFDNTLVLSAPSLEEFIKQKVPEIATDSSTNKLAVEFVAAIFRWHKVDSLREIEKIFDCVDIARATRKSFHLFSLIILSILKRKYPEYFQKYLFHGRLPYESSYSGPSRQDDPDKLPIQHSAQHKFNETTSTYISFLCHRCLTIMSEQPPKKDLDWLQKKFENHELAHVLPYFISTGLLNNSVVTMNKSDYVAVVNFAGHIE